MKTFEQILASLKKKEEILTIDEKDHNDLRIAALIGQIKSGEGDVHLPQLLTSEHDILRITAQKRVCWLERRK